MPGAVDVFSRGSKVLLDWIRNPRVGRVLGRKGCWKWLEEVSLGRDYAIDLEEGPMH